jgi:hypothetical protein
MRRREFITLLGGAALAWPRAVCAQQVATPVIGYLDVASPGGSEAIVAAFRRGLGELATSRARTSPLSIAGRVATMNDCQN